MTSYRNEVNAYNNERQSYSNRLTDYRAALNELQARKQTERDLVTRIATLEAEERQLITAVQALVDSF